jgi:hypothetical protein
MVAPPCESVMTAMVAKGVRGSRGPTRPIRLGVLLR